MYTGFPYMMPSMGMQTAAPVANTLANASNLGTGLSAAKAAGTSLFNKINWGSILSNTQKTLNVVNQAIPLYYQVKPVFKNIRALGRIGKEFSKIGINGNNSNNEVSTNNNGNTQTNLTQETSNTVEEVPEPTFFL